MMYDCGFVGKVEEINIYYISGNGI